MLYTKGYLSNPTHSSWLVLLKVDMSLTKSIPIYDCLQTQVSSEESLLYLEALGDTKTNP